MLKFRDAGSCCLDRHNAKGSESVDELFHVLPKDRFLTVGNWAYVPVGTKAILYQLIPVFRLYEPGAVHTGVPVDAAMISRVLLKRLGISVEIAARRLMLHDPPPCFFDYPDLVTLAWGIDQCRRLVQKSIDSHCTRLFHRQTHDSSRAVAYYFNPSELWC